MRLEHPDIITDFSRMTPAQHLQQAQRAMERHINACPTSPERDALTEANIVLMGHMAEFRA